jgi:hypothetical protein
MWCRTILSYLRGAWRVVAVNVRTVLQGATVYMLHSGCWCEVRWRCLGWYSVWSFLWYLYCVSTTYSYYLCELLSCIPLWFALYIWYFSIVSLIGFLLITFIISIVSSILPYEYLSLPVLSLLCLISLIWSTYRVLKCLPLSNIVLCLIFRLQFVYTCDIMSYFVLFSRSMYPIALFILYTNMIFYSFVINVIYFSTCVNVVHLFVVYLHVWTFCCLFVMWPHIQIKSKWIRLYTYTSTNNRKSNI